MIYEQFERTSHQIDRKDILDSFGLFDSEIQLLEKNGYFDKDVFFEAYDDLSKELLACRSKKEYRDKITRWYADLHFVKSKRAVSAFAEKYSMDVPQIYLKSPGSEHFGTFDISISDILPYWRQDNNVFTGHSDSEHGDVEQATVQICGPVRFFDCDAGGTIIIKDPREHDVLTTSRLTECTVIAIKSDDFFFISHVKNGNRGVRDMLSSLKEKLEGIEYEITMVYPKVTYDEKKYSSEQIEQYQDREYEMVREIWKMKNMTLMRYPAIGYGYKRPEGVGEYSCIMSKEGIQVVGINREYIGSEYDLKAYGDNAIRKIVPSSTIDQNC
jgi:hypothetical protein